MPVTSQGRLNLDGLVGTTSLTVTCRCPEARTTQSPSALGPDYLDDVRGRTTIVLSFSYQGTPQETSNFNVAPISFYMDGATTTTNPTVLPDAVGNPIANGTTWKAFVFEREARDWKAVCTLASGWTLPSGKTNARDWNLVMEVTV